MKNEKRKLHTSCDFKTPAAKKEGGVSKIVELFICVISFRQRR
jgi:hypothetical protein